MLTTAKYAPLTAFLRAQPTQVDRITLTLAEIEALIGGPLPRTAYTKRQSWWSNGRSLTQMRAWREAGWRVAALPWRPDGPPYWGVTFAREAQP
jgi:hypothetical protein